MKRSVWMAGIGLFLSIGAVAGGLYLFEARRRAAAAMQQGGEPPQAVTPHTVATATWQPTTDLVGTVISLRSVTVQNELAGVVTKVGFESGDIVEAGQVLVELDGRTDRAELETARASLRVAEAEVEVVAAQIRLAQAELDRQRSAGSRAVSAMDLDRASAELERVTAQRDRALASVEEARARIQTILTRLDKMIIRAPFRARVGLRTVHEGQFLAQPMGMDSAAIATLQEVADTIYVDFAVPQEHLSRVQNGARVEGVEESPDPTRPGRPVTLTVTAVDASASNVTRNVRVRAVVDNREDRLRPGMFVRIRVPIDDERPFVVVPVTAVRRASYADKVFVLEAAPALGGPGAGGEAGGGPGGAGMVSRERFVRLGPTIGERVIVLEGLRPGEVIAAAGSFKLRDGGPVIPAQEAPGAGATSPTPPAPTTSATSTTSTPPAPTAPAPAVN